MPRKAHDTTVNTAHIKGRVVREPFGGQGRKSPYAFVTVATGTGDYTAFHKVAAFGALAAEVLAAQKGDILEVEGRISYRQQVQGEVKWYEASIIADVVVNHSIEPGRPQEEHPIDDEGGDIPF